MNSVIKTIILFYFIIFYLGLNSCNLHLKNISAISSSYKIAISKNRLPNRITIKPNKKIIEGSIDFIIKELKNDSITVKTVWKRNSDSLFFVKIHYYEPICSEKDIFTKEIIKKLPFDIKDNIQNQYWLLSSNNKIANSFCKDNSIIELGYNAFNKRVHLVCEHLHILEIIFQLEFSETLIFSHSIPIEKRFTMTLNFEDSFSPNGYTNSLYEQGFILKKVNEKIIIRTINRSY